MKKLFLLILFFSISILTFGANVYFDPISGYIYDNGQTFYSDQGGGYASIPYHIIVPSPYFVCDANNFGARFQDPDGNWSDWSYTNGYGVHHCTKAGTWHVQARAYVIGDMGGSGHYWMYSSFTLYCYVVDNYAPSIPQNLAVGLNPGDNHIKLTWNNVSQADLSSYLVYRKVNMGSYNYIASTTSSSFVDPNFAYNDSPFDVYYEVRAKDVNNNTSDYSSSVLCHPYPFGKKTANYASTSIPLEYDISNYPNPFNPTTNIVYQIKEKGFVSLKVFNILGQEVANLVNEEKGPGIYNVKFNER